MNSKDIRILSVRQPWAELIVLGHKNVENRGMPVTHRGLLLIHASKTPAEITDRQLLTRYGVRVDRGTLRTGGIIGVVNLVACVEEFDSPWFDGPYGWVLRDAQRLSFVAHRGNVSLMRASPELLKRIGKSKS